ncbi:MAG: SDR family NAD(P)-dependent oxidoreductase, partial [Proteobacteria bacterium]|nr:SDR family NAD(P)-dependent oxidoreductase [Pseudomonadota bacterium]
MKKQVVLITGALAGIGRATAVAFAEEGAHLIISGRREEEGQSLARELRTLGAEVDFVLADVRYEEEIKELVNY